MTYRDNAKAPYTRQIGDPADGFITGADAQWSVDLLADEIDTKASTAALTAVTDELGTDPSGAAATVTARFEAIEANGWVTAAKIADGVILDGGTP